MFDLLAAVLQPLILLLIVVIPFVAVLSIMPDIRDEFREWAKARKAPD